MKELVAASTASQEAMAAHLADTKWEWTDGNLELKAGGSLQCGGKESTWTLTVKAGIVTVVCADIAGKGMRTLTMNATLESFTCNGEKGKLLNKGALTAIAAPAKKDAGTPEESGKVDPEAGSEEASPATQGQPLRAEWRRVTVTGSSDDGKVCSYVNGVPQTDRRRSFEEGNFPQAHNKGFLLFAASESQHKRYCLQYSARVRLVKCMATCVQRRKPTPMA